MSDRVKQIIQNIGGAYPTPVPIGSQGQYIDMFSNLDLEEELKLGGNHIVEIKVQNSDNISNSTISEWYGSSTTNYTHRVETVICQNKESTVKSINVNSYLYKYNPASSNEVLLHHKQIDFTNNNNNIKESLDPPVNTENNEDIENSNEEG